MQEMTKKERVQATLARQPVDRIAVFEHFWGDTGREWREKGWLKEGEDLNRKLDLDMCGGGWLNGVADLDFVNETVAEDEDTITVKDGNGAILRRHKHHDTTPEHVGFTVEEAEQWDELIRPHLLDVDRRRINFEAYRNQKKKAEENNQFFFWSYVGPFEQMHPVCGHENMLMGMLEDPEWIADMVDVFTDMSIKHAEVLFAEEGEPDGVWFYEDMGFKEKPFMSPEKYKELIQPGHKKLFDWAHSKGKKVIVHSCGFVEPLVPGMIEAGMDCLQVIEVKAGMDLLRLAREYGDRIAFCGGMDVREIYTNDKARIDALLENVLKPVLEMGASYILHSDHSIPYNVDYETLCYFQNRAREMSLQYQCKGVCS